MSLLVALATLPTKNFSIAVCTHTPPCMPVRAMRSHHHKSFDAWHHKQVRHVLGVHWEGERSARTLEDFAITVYFASTSFTTCHAMQQGLLGDEV